MVLPLHKTGQIKVGNALRLDWLEVCPPVRSPTGAEQDLGGPTGRLALETNGLENGAEPETYICGNPPYVGRRNQNASQKEDLQYLLAKKIGSSASLDYVFGWLEKASDYVAHAGQFAFVTTNSVTQGSQIPIYWPHMLNKGVEINFAHRSFLWSNNASNNAGVTCVILGVGPQESQNSFMTQAIGMNQII